MEDILSGCKILRAQGNPGNLTRVWSYDFWSGGGMKRAGSEWERKERARPTSELDSL